MNIFSFKLLLLIAGVAGLAATEAVCAQSTTDKATPMAGPEPSPSAGGCVTIRRGLKYIDRKHKKL